jgi:uncharacterized protein YkwD
MRLLTASQFFVLVLVGMLSEASSARGDKFRSMSAGRSEDCELCLSRSNEKTSTLGRDNAGVQGAPAPPDLNNDEDALIKLTNVERRRASLALFIPDPALMHMAREHSRSMARLQQLSHTIEGRSFSVRLNESGYQSMAAGENVAEGQVDATEAVQDWMRSPGHRTNIMNGQYSHIGVAVSVSKSGRRFYTQVFARPLPQANSSVAHRGFRCPSCHDRSMPLTKGQESHPNNVGRADRVVAPHFNELSSRPGRGL